MDKSIFLPIFTREARWKTRTHTGIKSEIFVAKKLTRWEILINFSHAHPEQKYQIIEFCVKVKTLKIPQRRRKILQNPKKEEICVKNNQKLRDFLKENSGKSVATQKQKIIFGIYFIKRQR